MLLVALAQCSFLMNSSTWPWEFFSIMLAQGGNQCWIGVRGFSFTTQTCVCLLQGKNARLQRDASSNVRKLTKMAAQTISESKRKLPKILLWGRTN
jgi:hypothetical protein